MYCFKVEATNSGETAKGGTLTLTDVVPAGLTPVSGVTVGGHETDGTINGQTVTYTKQFGEIGRNQVRKSSVEFVLQTLLELLNEA